MTDGFNQIEYEAGYKYKLKKRACFITDILPSDDIKTDFIKLSKSGILFVEPGYAWDGASGPTIDTKSSMRASLLHDALYGLMRDKLLSGEPIRRKADMQFYILLKKDGMLKIRAKVWYRSVRRWAKKSSVTGRKVLTAP